VNDAADHPLIVDPRHPVREREVGRDPPDLAFVSQNRSAMAAPPAAMESANHIRRYLELTGPEPSPTTAQGSRWGGRGVLAAGGANGRRLQHGLRQHSSSCEGAE
jgi:hypothetical protein